VRRVSPVSPASSAFRALSASSAFRALSASSASCARRLPSLAVAAALALGAAGCETFSPLTCDRSPEGNPLVSYTDGKVTDGVYATSAWDGTPTTSASNGELLYFPGGMRYSLVHHLPARPQWVLSYLSFDEHGTLDGGGLAQAAGNQVVIQGIDDNAIRLANDSCVEYWLRVTAGAGEAP
jgi:hypothetical protein